VLSSGLPNRMTWHGEFVTKLSPRFPIVAVYKGMGGGVHEHGVRGHGDLPDLRWTLADVGLCRNGVVVPYHHALTPRIEGQRP